MSKKSHVERLERKIKELQGVFESFGDAKSDLDELWNLIHKQGWTTLAESMFVEATVDAEKKYAQTTLELHRALLEGSRIIELNPQPLPP